ncbi:glycosyltransferase [Opitutus terrae]|uniref:Glycosyl transferase group 1 n=1 Tax=Opitutus terrae (strain DSM 11246 / JCM 15787 / PB90-1) TaxID=452637 RepID=B1ZW26_OPITP|nr:glycosyltransferase [Opitutus terrae]ACB76040.1 glycosyl transferase group 1 [Opitutus terrae PB90-1]
MRILLAADPILPVPPTGYGGIERIVDALIRELRTRGHAVGLIAKRGSTCTCEFMSAWPGESVAGKADTLRNALALSRAVRDFDPDVIHSFARLAYLTAVLPSRRPKIMSYQRHTSPAQVRPALRLARRGTLTFTACSEYICIQGRSPSVAWHAIHNFADITRIDFAPQVPADAPLLFLSRVESIKGPDLAIAIARRAGRRLWVAGNRPASGPEAAFFRDQVEPHLGRNGIEWIGEVDDRRKNELLGQCAALLVPIQWDEPFGIVFAEALAAGTPVLSCARGALPEIVQPGVTGLFLTNVDDGAAAVRRIPELDRTVCRRDAEQRFSPGGCVERYLKLYAECVANCTVR